VDAMHAPALPCIARGDRVRWDSRG
jgi:hypothetical protein